MNPNDFNVFSENDEFFDVESKRSGHRAPVLRPITYRLGRVEDCSFIAHSSIMAERSHLSISVWDIFFEGISEELKVKCLSHLAEEPNTCLWYGNFIIACDGNISVGACSYYPYTSCFKSESLKTITSQILEWKDEDFTLRMNSINFIYDDNIWPMKDFNGKKIPWYCNTYYIDTVYVARTHRGRGICSSLLELTFSNHVNANVNVNVIIIAAIGNKNAIEVYKKFGFITIQQMKTEECQHNLGHDGYNILWKNI
jgi:hypothetical protein